MFYRALPEVERRAFNLAQSGAHFGELCEGLLLYHSEDTASMRAAELLRTWVIEQWLVKCAAE